MREVERSPFGKRVRDRRKALGLTQIELAKKVGISQGTLAEMEKTGQGSASTPQLARALECSAEWLATGEGSAQVLATWPFKVLTPEGWAKVDAKLKEEIEQRLLGSLLLPSSGEPHGPSFRRDGTNG